MARRLDTGWRDGELPLRHGDWDHAFPVPGMGFPMIEYDHGEPVAVISYLWRGEPLPTGRLVASAYRAFARLYSPQGSPLPFFTVRYDPRTWAYQVFGHNHVAREFLGDTGWVTMTEKLFVSHLFRLRDRHAPDLSPYNVHLSTEPWIQTEPSPDAMAGEKWRHEYMSVRRRCFEPAVRTRASWRNPCVDIDLASVSEAGHVALIVDYKAPGAKINVNSTNVAALSSLYTSPDRQAVPAMVVGYEPRSDGWTFRVHCANQSARLHLSYVLGMTSTDAGQLAACIAGADWVELSESQWRAVLDAARYL